MMLRWPLCRSLLLGLLICASASHARDDQFWVVSPVWSGSVTIDATPDEGNWTLTGPPGFTTVTGAGDRLGSATITHAPLGDYTLVCDDNVTSLTPPSSQTLTLAPQGRIAFRPVWALVVYLPGDVPMELVRIPAGSFEMGRYPGEQDSQGDEDPQHTVTIGYGFYLGKYEVTKAQWEAVMGTTPWSSQPYVLDDPNSPAIYVSWNDIVGAGGFVETLNAHLASSGQGPVTVRLPSESEWEYACRAGTTTRFYWGDDPSYSQIGDYAWWDGNAFDVNEKYAHIVGQKLPNTRGLHDMSGNVWELFQDDYHSSYNGSPPTDGSPWGDGTASYRVVRGGCWYYGARYCRSAYRSYYGSTDRNYNIGFRLARGQ